MRILVVIQAVGVVYGGPSKSVIELAQALGCAGAKVDVVTTNANGEQRLSVPINQWIQKENYQIQYFPYYAIGDYKFSYKLTQWFFTQVHNYDLVQTNGIFAIPNLPAYFACKYHNIPYTVIPRGMLEPWALRYKAWKKRLYYALFEQPALQHASAIHMLSSAEAQRIQPLTLMPYQFVSPNGIHREDFEKLPDSEIFYEVFPETRGKKLLLFLSRVDPKKGLDILAEAFGRLNSRFIDMHLVVAGPDNIGFLSRAREYFENQRCLDKVTFTGMISGEMKYAALSAADVYVLPSYSEGFSMSVLEGMAAGLPCVITTDCNFPEAADSQVAHVVSATVDDIAFALEKCFLDLEASSLMGERARRFIFESYTWDKIASRLLETYKTVLEQQSTLKEDTKEAVC